MLTCEFIHQVHVLEFARGDMYWKKLRSLSPFAELHGLSSGPNLTFLPGFKGFNYIQH